MSQSQDSNKRVGVWKLGHRFLRSMWMGCTYIVRGVILAKVPMERLITTLMMDDQHRKYIVELAWPQSSVMSRLSNVWQQPNTQTQSGNQVKSVQLAGAFCSPVCMWNADHSEIWWTKAWSFSHVLSATNLTNTLVRSRDQCWRHSSDGTGWSYQTCLLTTYGGLWTCSSTIGGGTRLAGTTTGCWQGRLHHINDGANAGLYHGKSRGVFCKNFGGGKISLLIVAYDSFLCK